MKNLWWTFHSLYANEMEEPKCKRDYAYSQFEKVQQVMKTLSPLKNSQWYDSHLRQTRKLHKREKAQCRSLVFYDQETSLPNSISFHSRLTISVHQLQTLRLMNPYKFHLLEGVLSCIYLSVSTALQNEHRSSGNIHSSK